MRRIETALIGTICLAMSSLAYADVRCTFRDTRVRGISRVAVTCVPEPSDASVEAFQAYVPRGEGTVLYGRGSTLPDFRGGPNSFLTVDPPAWMTQAVSTPEAANRFICDSWSIRPTPFVAANTLGCAADPRPFCYGVASCREGSAPARYHDLVCLADPRTGACPDPQTCALRSRNTDGTIRSNSEFMREPDGTYQQASSPAIIENRDGFRSLSCLGESLTPGGNSDLIMFEAPGACRGKKICAGIAVCNMVTADGAAHPGARTTMACPALERRTSIDGGTRISFECPSFSACGADSGVLPFEPQRTAPAGGRVGEERTSDVTR